MLDCELAQVYLSARLDGEITLEEAAALEAHLKACPACRTCSEQLELLHQAMAEVQPVPPPAQLKADILARIAAEPRKKGRWRLWLPSAAVFALILLGTYTLGGSSGGSSSPPQALDAGLEQQAETSDTSKMRIGTAMALPGTEERGSGGTEPVAPVGGEAPAATAGNAEVGGAPENAAPVPNPASEPAGEAAGTEAYSKRSDSSDKPQYCGILTLSWTQAAPLLEGFSYTQEGGTRSYLLSASAFEELVQSLSSSYDLDVIVMDAQADQGLVLVTDAPG